MPNPNLEKLDTVRLVHERFEPIKQIAGFAKHHRVPTTWNDGNQRFVCDLCRHAVDVDLQEVFRSLRQAFGLKRKEISVNGPTDGVGVITTPFFNYEFHVAQSLDDPSRVLWKRMITEINEPARVFAGPFEEIFGNRFTILEISTSQPLDLESIVDHVEEIEPNSVSVDYDKDLNWCAIQIANSTTSVLVNHHSIRAISSKEISPRELLETFLRIQQEFISTISLAGIPFLAASD